MTILLSNNTKGFLNSVSTTGLPASYDYAAMYCDNADYIVTSSQDCNKKQTVDDLAEVASTDTKSVCSKNIALKNKALKTFRDRCYPFHTLDDIALYHKPKDIRDYITLQVHPFNSACYRDLSVRGGSRDFWKAVIKWCEVHPCTGNSIKK
jgi:hypothetical protein